MTSIFDQGGKQTACTIIEAGPCVVTQVKTVETDGYSALQVGYGDKKEVIPQATDIESLEYNLTSAIYKLTKKENPIITEYNEAGFWGKLWQFIRMFLAPKVYD